RRHVVGRFIIGMPIAKELVGGAYGVSRRFAPGGRMLGYDARLIGVASIPKYTLSDAEAGSGVVSRSVRRSRHGTIIAVQLPASLGVRPFRAGARPGQQGLERRVSALQYRAG